jgi:hypothetical protein
MTSDNIQPNNSSSVVSLYTSPMVSLTIGDNTISNTIIKGYTNTIFGDTTIKNSILVDTIKGTLTTTGVDLYTATTGTITIGKLTSNMIINTDTTLKGSVYFDSLEGKTTTNNIVLYSLTTGNITIGASAVTNITIKGASTNIGALSGGAINIGNSTSTTYISGDVVRIMSSTTRYYLDKTTILTTATTLSSPLSKYYICNFTVAGNVNLPAPSLQFVGIEIVIRTIGTAIATPSTVAGTNVFINLSNALTSTLTTLTSFRVVCGEKAGSYYWIQI